MAVSKHTILASQVNGEMLGALLGGGASGSMKDAVLFVMDFDDETGEWVKTNGQFVGRRLDENGNVSNEEITVNAVVSPPSGDNTTSGNETDLTDIKERLKNLEDALFGVNDALTTQTTLLG